MNKINTKKDFDASKNLKKEISIPAQGVSKLIYAYGEMTQENKVTKTFKFNFSASKQNNICEEREF